MVLHIEKQIKKNFPQVGHAPYRQVHAHSTGNKRSTVQNEADNLNRPERANEDGFFSHVVGNGRIIQLHEVGRGAWDVGGGWNAEGYAHVELIESHKNEEEFLVDYKLYVELLRQLAKEAGLPVTLDGVSRDTDGVPMGIVTHAYCTEHQPDNRSDHVDPYPYLAKWEISKEQFAKDLADGFEETEEEEKKKEEEEDMKNFVVRSKSGKQGYVGLVNGVVFGIASIDTVGQLKAAGAIELNLDDGDFVRFVESQKSDDVRVLEILQQVKAEIAKK